MIFHYFKLLSLVALTFSSGSVFAGTNECPLKDEYTQYGCSGTIRVKNASELNNHLSNYGFKKNIIISLEIDSPINNGAVFPMLGSSLDERLQVCSDLNY